MAVVRQAMVATVIAGSNMQALEEEHLERKTTLGAEVVFFNFFLFCF